MENVAQLKETLSSNPCKCDCHHKVDLLLQNALKDKKEIRELELKFEGLTDKIKDKDQIIAAMQLSIDLYKNNIESSSKLMDYSLVELKVKLSDNEAIIKKKEDQLDKLQALIREYEIKCKKEMGKKKELRLTITNLKSRLKADEAQLKDEDDLTATNTDLLPLNGDNSIFELPTGLGWIVVQRRLTGRVEFQRAGFDSYVNGFGDLKCEFWLGLEKMHFLTTSERYELYIQLVDNNNGTCYARYDHFIIGNKSEQYCLKSLGKYSGDAGDAMRRHETDIFKDNWWGNFFKSCNLNGPSGIWWGLCGSLKAVQMSIRKKSTLREKPKPIVLDIKQF